MIVPEAPDAIAVTAMDCHRLWVELADGRRGIFDVGDWLVLPAYAALRDPTYFARVGVAHGVLCWPNEEDFAPETVEARLRESTQEDPASSE